MHKCCGSYQARAEQRPPMHTCSNQLLAPSVPYSSKNFASLWPYKTCINSQTLLFSVKEIVKERPSSVILEKLVTRTALEHVYEFP